MIPCQNGFVFVVKEEQDEKTKISYKMMDFERMTLAPVTRKVYLLTKFGNHFDAFDMNPEDFLPCRTLFLPDHKLLTVDPQGQGMVYASDGSVTAKLDLTYRDCPPSGLAADENYLYLSYEKEGTIWRHQLKNLRRDMRYGGGDSRLPNPTGLFCQLGKVLFCAPADKKIYQFDPVTYQVEEYYTCEEPVHQYLKYHANEIVLLDSGIYKL